MLNQLVDYVQPSVRTCVSKGTDVDFINRIDVGSSLQK